MRKLVVITGPTATGKTGVAVDLAKRFDAEVISADSMQVYRGFDIGTAKPGPAERQGIFHHLIDVAEPNEPFDAARFKTLADDAVRAISDRGRQVFVVGGTGLYIRALLHGLQRGPSPDPLLRAELMSRAEAAGWPAMHRLLMEKDAPTARRLHPNDGVRILRALEVVMSSGTPLSQWHADHQFEETRYDACLLCLQRPRAILNDIINHRVDQMMQMGFLAETRGLLDAGLSPDLKPMQGLGYRRLVAHLRGALTLEEAVEKIKTDTRRFAKRQVTWFKKEPHLTWAPPTADDLMPRIEAHLAGRPA
jgi:tRNA dimethylallyltransferase